MRSRPDQRKRVARPNPAKAYGSDGERALPGVMSAM